jgi:DeoR family fructose operon transcriptional repressor
MMFEERARKILSAIKKQGTVTFHELADEAGISESTIRRDIAELDKQGKLRKVRGGAVSLFESIDTNEADIVTKSSIYVTQKRIIAEYAASLINRDDMVYIDAGTTTLRMIPYIQAPGAVFVTNGFEQAKGLAAAGYTVYLTGGKYKHITDALIGSAAVTSIKKYNFTKCFMGANGLDIDCGCTTPDIEEALIKEAAVSHSYITYILADSSKFGKISTVTFSELNRVILITDTLPDPQYKDVTIVKEVAPAV